MFSNLAIDVPSHTLHIIIKFLAFPGKQTHRIPDFWFAARQKAPSIRIDHD
jgi:hypothetical protein